MAHKNFDDYRRVELVDARKRIAKLEAALSQIASATYGTELHDTDAERADVYWRHLQRAQQISRGALKHE